MKFEAYKLMSPYVLLCVALFVLPLNAKKIYINKYTYIEGVINEYLSYFIYISDLAILLLIIAFLAKNKKKLREIIIYEKHDKCTAVMLVLLLWIALGILYNYSYYPITVYQFGRFFEAFIFALIIKYVVNDKAKMNGVLHVVSVTGTLQAIIAIFQYAMQKNIFEVEIIRKMLGESVISLTDAGTATLVENSLRIMRPYGTFSHPNVLGGYLLVSMLVTLALSWQYNNTKNKISQVFNYFIFSFGIQFIAFIYSYSRSAWFAFLIGSTILALRYVSRETYHNKSILVCIEKYRKISAYLIIITVISILNFESIANRILNIGASQNSISERILQNNVSRETIMNDLMFGVGIGGYVPNINNKFNDYFLYPWQYQPDHSAYMLIVAEIGLIGMLIFIYLIYNIIINVSRETFIINILLFTILIISIFDHYYWTSQQGRLVMFMIFGITLASKKYIHNSAANSGIINKNVPRETIK